MRYADRQFEDEAVELDGNEFVRCRFHRCRLIFAATGPAAFDGCDFVDCHWVLDGSAAETLEFLAGLRRGLGEAGQELVDGIFASVSRGAIGEVVVLRSPVPAESAVG
jgi:hypothetical protein